MDTNTNNQGEHGAYVLRRFHVLDNAVEHDQTTTTTKRPVSRNSGPLFGLHRSFGLQEGGQGSPTLPAAARSGAEASTEHQAVEGGQGVVTRTVTHHEVEPAPLRTRGYRDGFPEEEGSLMSFERRYRGEGFLERRGPGLGSYPHGVANTKPERTARRLRDENRPTPLAQQVLRLEDGRAADDGTSSSSESEIAVVRVVLEPPPAKKCDCDRALHPGKGNQEDAEDIGLQRNLGLCEVRGVVRVEAYLPGSSTTLTLRVKAPATATASTRGIEGSAAAEKKGIGNAKVLPLRVKVSTTVRGKDSAAAPARADRGGTADAGEGRRCEKQLLALADAGHEEECRSRKQQRRLLWEACAAEARGGAAELLAAVQEAMNTSDISQGGLLSRKNAGVATEQHQSLGIDKRADDSQPKLSNAFSMLLIRANVVVPIKRLSMASGSWREAIAQLVGCPPGQELRAVRVVSDVAKITVISK